MSRNYTKQSANYQMLWHFKCLEIWNIKAYLIRPFTGSVMSCKFIVITVDAAEVLPILACICKALNFDMSCN